jgi:hypothetical protein
MMLEHLTIYGRVKSVGLNRNNTMKGKSFFHMVTFTVILAQVRPLYAYGSHMEVVTENETYKIYNPQGLAFDINQLMSLVKTYMRTIGAEIVSIGIVDSD